MWVTVLANVVMWATILTLTVFSYVIFITLFCKACLVELNIILCMYL